MPPDENPAIGSAITAFMAKHPLDARVELPVLMMCASIEKVGLSAAPVIATAPSSAAATARMYLVSPIDVVETKPRSTPTQGI
jgi:hypothetical protein